MINLTNSKIVQKEWVNKSKDIIHTLWERGWIDNEHESEYILCVIDENSEYISELFLVQMMVSCTAFAEEISELKMIGDQLEVKVITTLKYHKKLVEKYIEYSWGVTKICYRKI